jgi:predicted SprT family Zn-dependent metalloprotease
MANGMIYDYNLKGWKFAWNASKTKGGYCSYLKRTISLSLYYVRNNTMEEIRNALLHEVAHALAGMGTHHGQQWKEKCINLGVEPKRLLDPDVIVCKDYKHLYKCIKCGFTFKRHHRLSNYSSKYHKQCGPKGKLEKV